MYYKLTLIITLIKLISSLNEVDHKEKYIYSQFQKFIKDYNKEYKTFEEYISKYEIFKKNFVKIEKLSLDNNK